MQVFYAYYYEFRYRFLKWLWNLFSWTSKGHCLVLMYHHVTDEPHNQTDCCMHTLQQFRSSIESLHNLGYEFVSIGTFLKLTESGDERKLAVITFDDVPCDAYENAVPYLLQKQLPFTFFITTGFIGKDGYLTEDQLKDLDKMSLCTIGAHTVSHCNLKTCLDPYGEIRDSKVYLEKLLGHSVDYFAYPYGRQNSVSYKIRKLVEKVGFRCAFGTIQAPVNDISFRSVYYLPRVVRKF